MIDDQQPSSPRVPLEGEAPAQDIVSGGQGQPAIGQAGETIVVERPAPGQTVEIQAAPGQTYVLNFAPGLAQVQVQGDNFILSFDDNGDGTPDSQIVFLDLVIVADTGEAPAFQIDGTDIDAGTLLGQALALAGQDDAPLDDVAAGPGATGGGASAYNDNLGDIIDLLAAEDVIPPTELQFGLIELEDEILLLAADDAPPEVAIPPEVDPALIVGENVNDIDDESTPHHEQFPVSDGDHGEIVGGDGGDVLIGDVGGASLVGKTLNLALVLDTSNSMEAKIGFAGETMMRIEALDKAVEQLLDSLAGTAGATVRLHMVNFATDVKDVATFNIVVNGVVDVAVLQAAKDFILAEGESPTDAANGNTNYEAGFDAALDWFSDDTQTLDDPDFNQTIFVSDGVPNRAYQGDGTSNVINPGSNQAALDHVLGTAGGDTVSEYDGLHGPFKGVAGTVDAIGINVSAAAENRLDQLDDGDADNIATGEELSGVLAELTQTIALAAVGGDVIVGNDGDDLILGDAIFTDVLAGEQALGSVPGAGWSAIDSLIGSGFFDNDPEKAVEEEIIDFLRDPTNQTTYDFGRESLVDGVGREGGNDTIDGGAGNDLIFGQEGDDSIIGGTGDDSIIGGSGDDVMSGGDGTDLFSWTAASRNGEADMITDFETGAGGDVLDLANLLTGVPAGPSAADLDAYLDFSFAGGNTTITIDFDGGGAGTDTAAITLQGVDLSGAGSDEDIISSLMSSGNLMAA